MKVCPRIKPDHGSWYYVLGRYYCQYCSGRILDREYLQKIIDYNTPTKIKFRKDVIENELKIALNEKDLFEGV